MVRTDKRVIAGFWVGEPGSMSVGQKPEVHVSPKGREYLSIVLAPSMDPVKGIIPEKNVFLGNLPKEVLLQAKVGMPYMDTYQVDVPTVADEAVEEDDGEA